MNIARAIQIIEGDFNLGCRYCIHPSEVGWCDNRCQSKEAVNMAIEALSDRPHGEWIETTSGTICSNCDNYPYDDGEYHIANWHSDFCPHCGADMRQKK